MDNSEQAIRYLFLSFGKASDSWYILVSADSLSDMKTVIRLCRPSRQPNMKTVIRLTAGRGGDLAKIVLTDDDTTTEAITRAAIDLIESCTSLRDGDTITVTEE